MPFLLWNSRNEVCWRYGCISIWCTEGGTLADLRRVWTSFLAKLEMPMAFTLPVSSSFSIAAHVYVSITFVMRERGGGYTSVYVTSLSRRTFPFSSLGTFSFP